MNMYYLDSSAWVKLYLTEPGTNEISHLFNELSREQLASTGLGYVEVTSALARQQTARKINARALYQLQQQLKSDWKDLTEISITAELIDQAARLAGRFKLRGADAIHLAAALSFQNALIETNQLVTFVASDTKLLQAAQTIGLLTHNPVHHL